MYIANAIDLRFEDMRLRTTSPDSRPALLLENVTGITFSALSASRSWPSSFDVGLRGGNCSGVRVVDSPGVVAQRLAERLS